MRLFENRFKTTFPLLKPLIKTTKILNIVSKAYRALILRPRRVLSNRFPVEATVLIASVLAVIAEYIEVLICCLEVLIGF